MGTSERRAILGQASQRFRAAHAAIGDAVLRTFAGADEVEAYGMAGWQVQVRKEAPPDWRGTFDPLHLQVFPVERKAGITLHIWNPVDPTVLDRRATALQAAGFKVMRGCLQWNRKQDVPVKVVAALLDDMARRLRTA